MNVLSITADGLGAGWLGCYGNELVLTPHADRLAAGGVVFDRHYADAPARFGDARAVGPLPPKPLLAALDAALAEATPPWHVAVVVDWLLPPWRVGRRWLRPYFGDDAVDDDTEERLRPWRDPPAGPTPEPAAHTIDRLQRTFAGAVARADRLVGACVRRLRDRGLLDATAVVLASGHGLPLGEHGVVGAALTPPHEEVAHVPLVVRLPGAERAGWRVDALTLNSDLPGGVWLSLARGDAGPGRDRVTYAGPGGRAVRTAEWSLVVPAGGVGRLYRQPDDRWEVNDVRQHHLELAEELERAT